MIRHWIEKLFKRFEDPDGLFNAPAPAPHIPVGSAYVCLACAQISAGTNSLTCKVCGSVKVFHLASWMGRAMTKVKAPLERQKSNMPAASANRPPALNEMLVLTSLERRSA